LTCRPSFGVQLLFLYRHFGSRAASFELQQLFAEIKMFLRLKESVSRRPRYVKLTNFRCFSLFTLHQQCNLAPAHYQLKICNIFFLAIPTFRCHCLRDMCALINSPTFHDFIRVVIQYSSLAAIVPKHLKLRFSSRDTSRNSVKSKCNIPAAAATFI